ncbi:DUF1566 domain-containing protein [bacterium]|nr:DUF1566 domain-containing protein [bacterium]
MEWADAVDYCNNLNEGGYSDWRLPTRRVLRTLLSNCNPRYSDTIPDEFGACLGEAKYDGSYSKFGEIAFLWSAYKYTSGDEYIFGTDFLTGAEVVVKGAEEISYARCVRKDFSDSHEAKCLQGLPENANWVTDSITQTWDWDNMWTPTTEGKHGSNNENGCFFKCDSDYYYDKGGYEYNGIDIYGKCVNPCIPNPCEKVEHSTKECIGDVDRKDYRCKCESNWETFEDHICIPSSGIDGLAWSSKTKSATWSNAISYCDNLTEGGYDDWHLPTISELRTLIQNCPVTETGGECGITDTCLSNKECSNNSTCRCGGTETGYNVPSKYSKLGDPYLSELWSSSVVDNSYDDSAWYVDFEYAFINWYSKNQQLSFRCVRNK